MSRPAENLTYHLLDESLRELAGDAAFERGKNYFAEERVASLMDTAKGFKASVDGNESYTVAVAIDDSSITHECSCPVGREGAFCKHLVAACLAWRKNKSDNRKSPSHIVQSWLLKQDNHWLANSLLEQAFKDNRLFNRLLLNATREHSGKPLAELRSLIDRVTSTRGFIDADNCLAFANGIHDVINALEDNVASHPSEVADLCVHVLGRVKVAVENVDDSEGEMREVIEHVEEVHLKACVAAHLDPIVLAKQLFDLGLRSEYGEFEGALSKYALPLGEQGSAEYCRLARKEWENVPALTARHSAEWPDESRLGDRYQQRQAITRIMEEIARIQGRLGTLIEIQSRDLSSSESYRALIEMSREQDCFDEALAWARKGVAAFGDEGLEVLLAEELGRAGMHGDAINVIFGMFTQNPNMQEFLRLEEFARAQDDWPRWRDKAVGHVRKQLGAGSNDWDLLEQRSLLIEIYLFEGNVVSALAEAGAGECRSDVLIRLAESCSWEKPKEAIEIYTALVPRVLQFPSNRAYRHARNLLVRAAKLYSRIDQRDEFSAFLEKMRDQFKRKRNFMALLEKTKWP